MANIKDVLLELNPQWKQELKIKFEYREMYTQIQEFMNLPQIIALTGLRRVGKTTIMLKTAEDAIKNGLHPQNIIYFSFDELKDIEIREILGEYEKVTEGDIRQGKHLLLLDEIQKLEGWENQLKTIYDLHGGKIKIMISGSESLFIKRRSRETLAGRMFEFKVEPLSFNEFLHFKEAELKPISLYEKELARLFKEFTHTIGLPELVNIKERAVIEKYVKESIVEKVVYRDIPTLFNIRDTDVLKSLLNTIMEEPGQLIELSNLAKELDTTRQTISNYLTYLEDSFLLKKLYNYSRNRRKTERKLKKYYPTIISPNLLFKEDDLSRSKVFEWFIVNQLNVEFFWRDSYKNEVDVVKTDEKLTPIEIKYGKTDFRGLKAFMKKFKATKGYVITPDREATQKINGKNISVIPAFKFLLKQKNHKQNNE